MSSRTFPGAARRVVVVVLLGLVLSAAVFWLSEALATTALTQRVATCTSTGCFCEAPLSGWPRQIFASFSSLAFVFLGSWALVVRAGTPGTPEQSLRPMFGVVMVFIGASSFFYHSTLSFFGQFLDIFSMYAFGLLLALGALYRSGKLAGRRAVLLFVALSVALGLVQFELPDARRILFAALLLPGIMLELMPFVTGVSPLSARVRYLYIGVGTLALAYVIWLIDQSPLCAPDSPVQGHAAWHVLTAVAAFFILAHYRLTAHERAVA